MLQFLCTFFKLVHGYIVIAILAVAILLRAITLEEEAKNWYKKDSKRIKSDNFIRSNREKSNIAIANLNDWMAPWLLCILVVAIIFSPTVNSAKILLLPPKCEIIRWFPIIHMDFSLFLLIKLSLLFICLIFASTLCFFSWLLSKH